jgi:tetratricopeptide (TPR) repeat protein
LLAAGFLSIACPAAAAPRYLDDCVAPESSTYFRIESCTFSLQADSLDDKQRVQALLNRAQGYAAQFWENKAGADLAEAKRLAPDDPTVTAALSDLSHFIGGRQDRAIAGYKEILQQNPNDTATLAKLAMAYLVNKQNDLARQSFDKILKLEPDNADALTWRSTYFTQDKQYDLALADLERAVAADPNDTLARDYRAQALLYAGVFDRAIADLNITLSAHPRDSLFRFRAIAEYLTGNLAAAEEDFFHDLDIDPMYANLTAWRFFAKQRQGGDGGAELRRIITALDGRWPTELLKVLLDQATVDEALAAAAATPYAELRQINESQAHAVIGEWLLLKGDKAGAAMHFKAARDIGLMMAIEEVKARRAVIPADTVVEFTLARARLRELEP